MTPIQTLGQSLNHWQALYIVSIAVAVMSTMAIVTFAFHIQEHKYGLKISNYVYVVASVLAVVSTIVIVNKTKSLDAEKDRVANVEVNKAKKNAADALRDAATANQKAQEAKDETAKVEHENLKLGGQVGADAVTARAAEAALDAKNKETSDFAHALATQQGIMAQQAKVSPQLAPQQIQLLANILKPYGGQDVSVHTTADTVVERLASSVITALHNANISTKMASTDMGALYQGVSVAVHASDDVPPLANALVNGLRQFGIDVQPVADSQRVQAGQVAIFLGPN